MIYLIAFLLVFAVVCCAINMFKAKLDRLVEEEYKKDKEEYENDGN